MSVNRTESNRASTNSQQLETETEKDSNRIGKPTPGADVVSASTTSVSAVTNNN